MKVLLIGQGAREHAIAWKLSQSELLTDLTVWPGNTGMRQVAMIAELDRKAKQSEVVKYAVENRFDLVVVGPEAPLAHGLADALEEAKVSCFGPKKSAARLESSKVFAKTLMKKAGVPTARFEVVTDKKACFLQAKHLLKQTGGAVIKASGLAGGKGVFGEMISNS